MLHGTVHAVVRATGRRATGCLSQVTQLRARITAVGESGDSAACATGREGICIQDKKDHAVAFSDGGVFAGRLRSRVCTNGTNLGAHQNVLVCVSQSHYYENRNQIHPESRRALFTRVNCSHRPALHREFKLSPPLPKTSTIRHNLYTPAAHTKTISHHTHTHTQRQRYPTRRASDVQTRHPSCMTLTSWGGFSGRSCLPCRENRLAHVTERTPNRLLANQFSRISKICRTNCWSLAAAAVVDPIRPLPPFFH